MPVRFTMAGYSKWFGQRLDSSYAGYSHHTQRYPYFSWHESFRRAQIAMADRRRRRGMNLGSCLVTVQWGLYSVRLTAKFAGPEFQFSMWQLTNPQITKLLPDDPATILL
jgi:hypothetical protein